MVSGLLSLTVAFVLGASARSGAEILESKYLSLLARAQSPAQAMALREAYRRLKVTRTACQIQLREKAAPTACFQDESQSREQLDRLCEAAAAGLRINGPPNAFVSEGCAQKIREGLRIQAYKHEESWSEN